MGSITCPLCNEPIDHPRTGQRYHRACKVKRDMKLRNPKEEPAMCHYRKGYEQMILNSGKPMQNEAPRVDMRIGGSFIQRRSRIAQE